MRQMIILLAMIMASSYMYRDMPEDLDTERSYTDYKECSVQAKTIEAKRACR